jgi:predicted extracellular nuclease
VLVLNEISDNSGSVDDGVVEADKTVKKLLEAILKAGGPAYSYSDNPPNNNQDGGLEGGNIRTILLYRNDKGITLDQESSQTNKITVNNRTLFFSENPLFIGNQSAEFYGTRKPRVWLLSQDNNQFIVVGAHLTSQGANSPDWGNLQPPQKPEETKRINQAQMIYEQMREISQLNPQLPIFVIGDMNDLPWSKTVSNLSQDLFFNTAEIEKPEERYSYIFEGNAQELDYIFVNKNLADNVIQARFIHVNSFLDQSESISDHDPVIIEFDLNH